MNHITANELKTKGVSIFQTALQQDNEAIITVHGKPKYVVIDVDMYQRLRELELEMALAEVKSDLQQGRYQVGNIDNHIKHIKEVTQ